MSSGVQLYKLGFDPADAADDANVGAFLRAGSDGDLLSSTLVSGKEGLDVYLINASIAVTATDLDIRDLAFATDSVDVSGSSVSISGSVTVTATDLDIRDLAFATDSVTAYQGGVWAVSAEALDTIANDEITVGTLEVELVAASPVTNRRYVLIQNMSNNPIYVGATGLATTDGIMIPKGGNLPLEASAGVFAIAGSAGNAVRILELGF